MKTFNEWIRYGSIIVPEFQKKLISEFGISEKIYNDWLHGKYQPPEGMQLEIEDWVKKLAKK